MVSTQEQQNKIKTILEFLTNEKRIVPFLFLLLVIFSFLLYRNITKRVKESENPVVGVISFKVNRVQRKFDGEVVWESIPTQAVIRNRDTIRTEKLSEAVLTLEDGTEIEIGENSMIVVDFSDKKYNLNFAYGSVGARREGGTADITIQSGDTAINMKDGEISLNKFGDKIDINVTEGEAKLIKGQEQKELEKNQSATIDKDSVNIKNQNIVLTQPNDRSIIIAEKDSENINFKWEILNPSIKNIRLLVSRDLRFKKLELNNLMNNTNFNYSFKPGVYYWKLQYIDSQNLTTETITQRFTILKKPEIRVFSPENGSKIPINPDFPKPVLFSWSPLESVSNYKLEISTDPELKNIIQSKETRIPSIGILNLDEGSYYYRITAISSIPDIKNIESNVINFLVTQETSNQPPKLIEPKDRSIISLLAIQEKGLLFSWGDTPGSVQYKIQISQNTNFNPIYWEDELNQNFIRWNPEGSLGLFYWRVISKMKGGNELTSNFNQFSIEQNLDLIPLKPFKNAVVDFIEDGKVVFNWKPLPTGLNIKLIISKDENFENKLLDEWVKGSGVTLNLPEPGEYFWKLVWEGKNSKLESEVFSFQLRQPILAPSILFPLNGERIDMTNSNELQFRWTDVREADSYQIRLLDITGFIEKEILNLKTKTNFYRFTDLTKLNQGKFRLEVKAIRVSQSRTGSLESIESKPTRSDFFITIQTGKIPRILTPEKIYVE